MTIKIVQQGALYTAEVTPPQGNWRSPRPLRSDELARELLTVGCRPVEVAQALREVGVQSFSGYYRAFAEETAPRVHAALAGEYEPPMQRAFTEAWLAYALFEVESALPLEEVIGAADSINHLIPTIDEIAWAFVRLRDRGWLAEQGNTYGLTFEGRRAIDVIVGEGGLWERIGRLEEWTSAHPPSGDEGEEVRRS